VLEEFGHHLGLDVQVAHWEGNQVLDLLQEALLISKPLQVNHQDIGALRDLGLHHRYRCFLAVITLIVIQFLLLSQQLEALAQRDAAQHLLFFPLEPKAVLIRPEDRVSIHDALVPGQVDLKPFETLHDVLHFVLVPRDLTAGTSLGLAVVAGVAVFSLEHAEDTLAGL
jgi:hypothetical protein